MTGMYTLSNKGVKKALSTADGPGRSNVSAEVRPGDLASVLKAVRACRLCAAELPHEPRPVVRASSSASLLIVGQAPGTRVHASGLPFDDPSGDRLRQWLQIEREQFYDESLVAFLPMGLCFPGQNASGGDLPPMARCAPTWHGAVRAALSNVKLVLLVGRYAQAHYLGPRARPTLTETVRCWRDYAPEYFPVPHPSWRNNAWLKRHPWFAEDVLPGLRGAISGLRNGPDR